MLTVGSAADLNQREGNPACPIAIPGLDDEPTIGKLVVDASRDVSSLIQSEIALVKSELRVSVKAGGVSVAMFGAAGFLALLSIICSPSRSPSSCT